MTAGYAARARFYADEISQVPHPQLLASLLRPALRVAEMPSGTGHFLPAYAAACADVTFVDSCLEMLEEARRRADHDGVVAGMLCTAIEDLRPGNGCFDLIVMPNAALNQLSARADVAVLLEAAARALSPGGTVLAQVLDKERECGFYDPLLADGTWRTDRRLTDDAGHQMTRRRRQHHQGNLVGIDFELRCADELLHRQRIDLTLLPEPVLWSASTHSEITVTQLVAGSGGLTEVLAAKPDRRRP